MNYLAHIFLSGNNLDIQLGNFMGDAIKGKKYEKFPVSIKKGILLHRYIDSYTDSHKLVKQSKKRISSQYGHYNGVLVDIFYDHFLVVNWMQFSAISLAEFVSNFRQALAKNQAVLDSKSLQIASHLLKNNWLLKTRDIQGIKQVLKGMEKRINYQYPLHKSIVEFEKNYSQLENDFLSFFPLLQAYTAEKLQTLNKQYET